MGAAIDFNTKDLGDDDVDLATDVVHEQSLELEHGPGHLSHVCELLNCLVLGDVKAGNVCFQGSRMALLYCLHLDMLHQFTST